MKFADLKLRGITGKLAKQLDSLREIYDEINLEPIFEPVILREMNKDKVTLLGTTGLDLRAWQEEIACSCVVKMKSVEESIINLLSKKDFYSSAILIRHHMELCGLLALSLDVLRKSLREKNIELLNKFMAKTQFGNSYANNPRLRDGYLAFGMSQTVTVSAMIRALDDFYNANLDEKPEHPHFVHNYAFLCQIAHPSLFSSWFFCEHEKVEDGQILEFRWEPNYGKNAFKSHLGVLRDNLIIGLACYFIFTSYQFYPDGTFTQDRSLVDYSYFGVLNRFN